MVKRTSCLYLRPCRALRQMENLVGGRVGTLGIWKRILWWELYTVRRSLTCRSSKTTHSASPTTFGCSKNYPNVARNCTSHQELWTYALMKRKHVQVSKKTCKIKEINRVSPNDYLHMLAFHFASSYNMYPGTYGVQGSVAIFPDVLMLRVAMED
jgi:hypothetical protein